MGDTGFSRISRVDADTLRVWRIQSLHERSDLRKYEDGILWCDDHIRFLRLPCVSLTYHVEERAEARSSD